MLLWPNADGVAGGGDLGRFAADPNGEVTDAKASNPVRFKVDSARAFEVEELKNGELLSDSLELGAGVDGPLAKGEVLELAHVDGLLGENMLGPFTEANGELVEAYAINPLYNALSVLVYSNDTRLGRTSFGVAEDAGADV